MNPGDAARILAVAKRLAQSSPVPPFSYAGPITISTSPPWTPDSNVAISEVRALLGTAGTSSTVVTVYVNGTSIGTVTLASGVTNNAATMTASLTANTDLVTVAVTTSGGAARDLTVLVRAA